LFFLVKDELSLKLKGNFSYLNTILLINLINLS